MKAKTVLIWTIILTAAVVVFGLVLLPRFPENIAIHWDEQGVADGYGSVFMGIWFLPLMTIGLVLLLLGLPKIDPLKKNIETFQNEYYLFILLFVLFFVYLQGLTLLFNLGYRFNMLALMLPAFGGFFYYIGALMGKAKRNYFIGIRTPWTLADDQVWDETHRVGANGFKISGLLTVLGVFFPSLSIWFMMVPLMVVAIFSVVYSYVVYRRYHPNHNGNGMKS